MNESKKTALKGGYILTLNDKVEVISNSDEEIFGMVGFVKDIKEGKHGTEIRLSNEEGFETWIDIDDLELYNR
ncbi:MULTISPECIES: hypothetical protein [Bacillus]|uniref:Uncharacterized protein n=1 Tax=Bacillus subtilis subsp. subtilis TaxID=135461 RepID=A0ABD3ZRV2_BACIU|nr:MULTISPECIES: hypothetical protein [Bacillus subtilis group]KIL30931.1 hypothetical protein B4067_4751 [Bacillus subtilis subsp. subtilis]KIN30918.1 hypothetical protein B4069_2991 [Bacillus subtilis]KIN37986.1 hypothetical protein B4071_2822 [Bacillus subtilis]KIN46328.1 hypothetical protein B4145_3598 [Bacillus subtilis]KIN46681.1 hypothetical protein B4072_2910 [Bacillus subtilis]